MVDFLRASTVMLGSVPGLELQSVRFSMVWSRTLIETMGKRSRIYLGPFVGEPSMHQHLPLSCIPARCALALLTSELVDILLALAVESWS
jgi:hypothetical protein